LVVGPNDIFQGFLLGLLYSLIALGYNIIYRVNKSINFSFPQLVLLTVYVALVVSAAVNIILAVVVALAVGVLVSVATERLVARPLLGRPPIALIGATLGVYYALKGVVILVGENRVDIFPIPYKIYNLGPIVVGLNDVIALVGSIASLYLIVVIHHKTSVGAAMRAVSEDSLSAAAYGLPLKRLMVLSWVMAGLVGGLGAFLLAVKAQVSPNLEYYALRALAASLLAGLDSVGGVVVGGIILGITEQVASKLLDPYLPGIGSDIAFFILLLILLVKPYGLFRSERIERV